jgi:hypothetical protein
VISFSEGFLHSNAGRFLSAAIRVFRVSVDIVGQYRGAIQ